MKQANQAEQRPEINYDLALEPVEADAEPVSRLRAGDLCPKCKVEKLDYDGLLNLSCPKCGPAVSGCFT